MSHSDCNFPLYRDCEHCLTLTEKMASDIERAVQEEVETNVRKIQPLLKRSDEDPRPIVLMMCGVAGGLGDTSN